MSDTSGGELRIFVEPLVGEDDAPRGASELDVMPIPDGGGPLALDEAILLEGITIEGRAVLAMSTPPGRRVRINGTRAARLSVLHVADQIQLDDVVLHVTYMRRPRVGPPPKDLVGKPCGVCSVPFASRSVVVAHDCGRVLHLEPKSTPAEDRLQCALLGCPDCNEPLVLEAGYAYEPEI